MSRFWLKRTFLSAAFLIAGAIGVGAQIPSAPALKSPANGIAGQSILETLSWNSVASATSYAVQVSTSSGFGTTIAYQSGPTRSVVLQNLTASTIYYWQVQASNSSGSSGWSAAWSFTTVHWVYDTATGDQMSIALQTSVHPTFNGVPLGVYDEIGVFSNAGLCVGDAVWDSVDNQVITVVGQSSLEGTDGLNPGDTMLFRVWHYATQQVGLATVTFSGGGTANYTSGGDEVIYSLTATSSPLPPTLLSPTNGLSSQPTALTLTWNTALGATSYGVQVSTSAVFTTTVLSQAGITGASKAATGLGNNTTYYWWTNATNSIGTSLWSSVWSFTTGFGAPTLAAPSNGSTGQSISPTLSWNTVTGATSYNVLVSTSTSFTTTIANQTSLTGLSASVSGLANGTPYYWEANAMNTGETSAWSNVWSFTTIVAAPGAPTLALPSSGSTGVAILPTLSWNTVTGATSYSVLVSTSTGFTTTIVSQTSLTGLSASVSGLANSATYYWEANATNAGGTSVWSSMWSFTTMAIPVAPTLSSPTNGATNQLTSLTLNWSTVTGATSYTVLVSTSTSFTTTVSSQNVSGLSASVSGLADSAMYYWEVSATSAGGTSAWSSVWSFTTTSNVTRTLSSHAGAIVPSFSFRNGNVLYTLPADAKVEIVFYDVLGRTALAISRAESAGSHIVNLRSCNLAPGRYLARLKSGNFERQILLFLAQ